MTLRDRVLELVTRLDGEQDNFCWAQREGSSQQATAYSCSQPVTHPVGLCDEHTHEILGV